MSDTEYTKREFRIAFERCERGVANSTDWIVAKGYAHQQETLAVGAPKLRRSLDLMRTAKERVFTEASKLRDRNRDLEAEHGHYVLNMKIERDKRVIAEHALIELRKDFNQQEIDLHSIAARYNTMVGVVCKCRRNSIGQAKQNYRLRDSQRRACVRVRAMDVHHFQTMVAALWREYDLLKSFETAITATPKQTIRIEEIRAQLRKTMKGEL